MTELCNDVKIAAIAGSVRPGNYTSFALALAVDELRRRRGVEVTVIDPAGLDLPLPGRGGERLDLDRFRAVIGEATGVLLATPEYTTAATRAS